MKHTHTIVLDLKEAIRPYLEMQVEDVVLPYEDQAIQEVKRHFDQVVEKLVDQMVAAGLERVSVKEKK